MEESAFIVRAGRITEVGRAGELDAPAGTERIELSGKTVTPLLVTLHTHPGYAKGVSFSEEHYTRETYANQLDTLLYYGLGVVVSLGVDRGELAFELKQEQRQGTLGGALLRTAGQGLAATDIDIVKIWVDDELVQLILDNDVFIISNLNVQAHPAKNDSLDDPALHETVSPELIAELRASSGAGRSVSEAAVATYRNMENSLRRLSEAGARIAFGSDSGIPRNFVGFSEHRELELMVAAGMEPLDVIRAATHTSADVLGLEDYGSLAPGMRAEFIVLDANPLEDIRNTRRIDSLYRDGEKLDRASLRH